MKKDKIIGIIIVIIGFILIGTGITMSIIPTNKGESKNTEKTEEKGQKENSVISIHPIEYRNYKFIEKDGKTYFKVTARNKKQSPTEIQEVRISFYNNKNEIISGFDVNLPVLQPKTDTELEFEYTGEKITGDYTIGVSEVHKSSKVG